MRAEVGLGVTQVDRMKAAQEGAAIAAQGHIDKLQSLREQLGNLQDVQLAFAQSGDRVIQAQKDLSAALEQLAGEDIQGTSDAALAARQAIYSNVDAIQAFKQGMIDSGASSEEMNAKLQPMYDTLVQSLLPAFGDNTEAVQHYLETLGLVPPSVDTEITAADEEAQAKADEWIRKLDEDVPDDVVSNLQAFLEQNGPGSLAAAKALYDAWVLEQEQNEINVKIRIANQGDFDRQMRFNQGLMGPPRRSAQGVPMYGPAVPAGLGATARAGPTIDVWLRPRTYGRSALGTMIPESTKNQPVFVENRVFLGDQEVKQLVRQETRVMDRDRSLAFIGGTP